jgi:hypothetical protein
MDGDALKVSGERHLSIVKRWDDDARRDRRSNFPKIEFLCRAYCTQDIVHGDEAGRAIKLKTALLAPFANQNSASA